MTIIGIGNDGATAYVIRDEVYSAQEEREQYLLAAVRELERGRPDLTGLTLVTDERKTVTEDDVAALIESEQKDIQMTKTIQTRPTLRARLALALAAGMRTASDGVNSIAMRSSSKLSPTTLRPAVGGSLRGTGSLGGKRRKFKPRNRVHSGSIRERRASK